MQVVIQSCDARNKRKKIRTRVNTNLSIQYVASENDSTILTFRGYFPTCSSYSLVEFSRSLRLTDVQLLIEKTINHIVHFVSYVNFGRHCISGKRKKTDSRAIFINKCNNDTTYT